MRLDDSRYGAQRRLECGAVPHRDAVEFNAAGVWPVGRQACVGVSFPFGLAPDIVRVLIEALDAHHAILELRRHVCHTIKRGMQSLPMYKEDKIQKRNTTTY